MVDSDLARIFETAGCDGALHAVDLATGCEVAWCADELVVPASVIKVAIALDLLDRAASGELDLAEQVTVEPSYLPSNSGRFRPASHAGGQPSSRRARHVGPWRDRRMRTDRIGLSTSPGPQTTRSDGEATARTRRNPTRQPDVIMIDS